MLVLLVCVYAARRFARWWLQPVSVNSKFRKPIELCTSICGFWHIWAYRKENPFGGGGLRNTKRLLFSSAPFSDTIEITLGSQYTHTHADRTCSQCRRLTSPRASTSGGGLSKNDNTHKEMKLKILKKKIVDTYVYGVRIIHYVCIGIYTYNVFLEWHTGTTSPRRETYDILRGLPHIVQRAWLAD